MSSAEVRDGTPAAQPTRCSGQPAAPAAADRESRWASKRIGKVAER
jgi:hypothetical protein